MANKLAEAWYKQCMKERAEAQWEAIPQGEHKCTVYLVLKGSKTVLNSNYFGKKILTKKQVEFLNSKTTKNNIRQKLDLIKNAEDTNIEIKFERLARLFDMEDLQESMLDDTIEYVNRRFEEKGTISISNDINWKIRVKIAD